MSGAPAGVPIIVMNTDYSQKWFDAFLLKEPS